MNPPAEALRHFVTALLMGAGLGLFYGFLRPLRPRLTTLSDLVFSLPFFWVWIILGFGVCQGDLRLGCSAGLPIGAFLWDKATRPVLGPIFTMFWRFLYRIFRSIMYPFQKIFKKLR